MDQPRAEPSFANAQVYKWLAVAAAAAVLWPFWPALVLAVWTGAAVQHWLRPFRRLTGERHRAAVALTVLTVLLILTPLLALAAAVASDAAMLVERTLGSREVQSFLRSLVAHSDAGGATPSVSELVSEHGARAWAVLTSVSSAAVQAMLGAVVFVITLYAMLAEGSSMYSWALRHSPLPPRVLARLGHAFHETGRGLFVGVLGAGLLQGAAAAIIFLALGVPRPIVLGFLTVVASVVPSLGSALVWGPVAAALAITERYQAAALLVVLGAGVIGTIDNVFRPLLSRRANLQLPAFLVLLAMLGGILLIGTWGFLGGPLVLRLAKEVLLLGAEPDASPAAEPLAGAGEAVADAGGGSGDPAA